MNKISTDLCLTWVSVGYSVLWLPLPDWINTRCSVDRKDNFIHWNRLFTAYLTTLLLSNIRDTNIWSMVKIISIWSCSCDLWLIHHMLKEKETQHSFAGLLNIYISGIWLWYMQALFINRVKQNRCLKSENPQPMVVTILPPCSGKQMWMWCSVVSSLLDGS